jgi:hypothetical protein
MTNPTEIQQQTLNLKYKQKHNRDKKGRFID